jgi:uncharacterized protein YdeI (YjbR/CyaY-like superfamily)
MEALREIALSCGLTEEMKWGKPCYTDGGSNIVLIQGFKAYCGLLFFKGYMLDDPEGILSDVGPNSRIGKQARFTDLAQIRERSAAVKACIEQAIAVERSGAAAELEQNDLPVPEEFQQKLDEDPALRAAFEALTPGRQREYLLYFSGAKQAKTRAARVEKFIPHILDGLGMRDA